MALFIYLFKAKYLWDREKCILMYNSYSIRIRNFFQCTQCISKVGVTVRISCSYKICVNFILISIRDDNHKVQQTEVYFIDLWTMNFYASLHKPSKTNSFRSILFVFIFMYYLTVLRDVVYHSIKTHYYGNTCQQNRPSALDYWKIICQKRIT